LRSQLYHWRNRMTEIITPELLSSWSPCDGVYKRFCELFSDGADLKTAVDRLVADDHDDWGYWLFSCCQDKGLFSEYTANGYRNAGDCNAGNRNSGNCNTGDRNSGDWNSGDRNTGNWNLGNWNLGDRNSGSWNAGDRNSGSWNAGDRNSGNWNLGSWNAGDRNSGHFNTTTPDTILVFNKPCSVEEWDRAEKPNFLYFLTSQWVYESDMSNEEKIANPKFFVMGGYLKSIDYKIAFKKSYDNAGKKDRELIKNLPNFDAEIFFEISGIDLRGEQK